jgi:hypothetical protein
VEDELVAAWRDDTIKITLPARLSQVAYQLVTKGFLK